MSEAMVSKESKNTKLFWRCFIGTVAVLMIVEVSLVINERRHEPSPEMQEAANVRVLEMLQSYGQGVLKQHFPETEMSLDESVDWAFQPAYDNVKKFAAVHYSLIGEYSELLAMLNGDLNKKVSDALFPELDARLSEADMKINHAFKSEISRKAHTISDVEEGPGDQQSFKKAVDIAMQSTLARFDSEYMAQRGISAIGGGASTVIIGKVAATAVSKKIVPVLVTKTAIKLGLKSGGSGGGAAAGATVGTAFGGPVGAIGGGIAGAIAAWFLVDEIFIYGDEQYNGEKFESDLRKVIDDVKAVVKAEIRKAIKGSIENLKNKTPAELIG